MAKSLSREEMCLFELWLNIVLGLVGLWQNIMLGLVGLWQNIILRLVELWQNIEVGLVGLWQNIKLEIYLDLCHPVLIVLVLADIHIFLREKITNRFHCWMKNFIGNIFGFPVPCLDWLKLKAVWYIFKGKNNLSRSCKLGCMLYKFFSRAGLGGGHWCSFHRTSNISFFAGRGAPGVHNRACPFF